MIEIIEISFQEREDSQISLCLKSVREREREREREIVREKELERMSLLVPTWKL